MPPVTTRNPLSRPGWWLLVGALATCFALWMFEQQRSLDSTIKPLTFLASLYFSLWSLFQYRVGEVSIVSSGGARHTYRRANEPIAFTLILLLIFVTATFLTIAIGSDLFLGCEGSLINSCQVSSL